MNLPSTLFLLVPILFVFFCAPGSDSDGGDLLYVLSSTLQRQAFCEYPGAIRVENYGECFHPVGENMILDGNTDEPVSGTTVSAGTVLKCLMEGGGAGLWYDYDPVKADSKQPLSIVSSDYLSYFPLRLVGYPPGRTFACVPEAGSLIRAFQKIGSVP
ncbi:hypothetical protein EHQ12_11345 [Leptospira gomenensis]|uniref:Uncharacterized protein n=1 Tax=Leptospira gomenensis TaxID=2484974 RepID=A0A5F1Y9S6_9LEPT|nr:hypothetical protein [Leptospira gomenensis]TGK33337.1 hypothetical protein EHQ17_11125 [Leptospira gomenensis]TGK37368.1 hypothetical protein EHQ12_11345 [Leptospira gomenensis]TGK40557.1 hypothetical protein EHQ07_18390 [Leptospira gomenensis]TGK56479.1 hypothetical protein EHQ13_14955 [Leptospira gomenensis]